MCGFFISVDRIDLNFYSVIIVTNDLLHSQLQLKSQNGRMTKLYSHFLLKTCEPNSHVEPTLTHDTLCFRMYNMFERADLAHNRHQYRVRLSTQKSQSKLKGFKYISGNERKKNCTVTFSKNSFHSLKVFSFE